MPFSLILCRVDLVWTDILEESRFTQDLHGATSQEMTFLILILSFPLIDQFEIENKLNPYVILVNYVPFA
jgi:hypothetical protein